MKKIIFIRHGKAEEISGDITDFERSLTLKGKIISRKMARRLSEKENSPGTIITSPAFRAIETAIIFSDEFKIDPGKIIINNILYYKMGIQYLPEILSLVKEETESVALFGHNPSFTQIADILCREGCNIIPKSGVVGISFNVMTWSQIKRNTGKLEYFLKPEKLL
jgi:phosphohistidine phosphatase